jgi:hypothetical protein
MEVESGCYAAYPALYTRTACPAAGRRDALWGALAVTLTPGRRACGEVDARGIIGMLAYN